MQAQLGGGYGNYFLELTIIGNYFSELILISNEDRCICIGVLGNLTYK